GMFNKLDVPTEYCDVHVMVKYDKKTNALCLDGCACPESDVIEVGLRKLTLEDRALHGKVSVGDAQYIYMDVPDGYEYPTSKTVPFFQNALPEDINFGYSSSKPANRVCIEHYQPEEPELPDDILDPENPESSDNPDEPDTPDEPAVPAG
ncbi:MAG: hypothetical protein IKC39_03400, partial [Clostridia bacterium]|nr:hypothetical protein [Clostridia bacterium]